jgi:hypothetical protein
MKQASKTVNQAFLYTITPSPNPSTFSAMKTPENTNEDPDDPERADEGGIQMEYSFA